MNNKRMSEKKRGQQDKWISKQDKQMGGRDLIFYNKIGEE